MIKNFLNRTISGALTLIILLGLFPAYAFSQPNPSSLSDIKGFSKSVFDTHFSRADRELNPDRWLKEARTGLTQAINAWELSAGNLYDSRQLLLEARNELDKWSNEELEKRFSLWLVNRFFGETALKTLTNMLVTFDETQKFLSWRLDDEGNILFDSKTGDPLIVRPNDSGREFKHDLAEWNDQSREIIINSEISFENSLISLYPDLLIYIPSELRATIGELFNLSASERNASIKREFENIAEREERIFSSRRTRDIWSLRNKNENEAARLFTERLIAETEKANNTGIEKLNILIEQASANTGDLAFLGDEWLRLYKEQFDRGLKAWEEAEERFFMRRIEWEQDSMRLYSEGEEIWLAAFSQFDDERRKWELKTKELFQSGEMMFINLSAEFDKKITEAKKEFNLNMEMRVGEGTARVKALIDMYLLCSSAAITAINNIEYWLLQYNNAEKPHPKNENFSAWLNNEISGNPRNNILSEISILHNLFNSYIDKALDARGRILENYSELLGTGLLKDILSSNASSEDFCLDEYQIALIRAKALVIYWERKTAISDAVKNYADELSAGRMTEAEGLRAWEAARNAYNKTLTTYEIELNKLNSASDDVRRQQEKLNELTILLQKEEQVLNKLNSEYTILASSSVINNFNNILNDINTKYKNVSDAHLLLLKSQDEAIYKEIIANGIKWGIAEQRETAEYIKNILDAAEDLSIEDRNQLSEEYNLLSSESQEEIWNNTKASLTLLFDNYGINVKNYLIPDIQDICKAIYSLSGNFIFNAAEFLLLFNYCFTSVPEWMGNEINTWKDLFTKYIAAFALNNNIIPEFNSSALSLEYEKLLLNYIDLYNYAASAENLTSDEIEKINEEFLLMINNLEAINNMNYITLIWENLNLESKANKKHWRQYLTNEYIANINSFLKPVFSWKEGIISDLLFSVSYHTNRLNDSLLLYSQRDSLNINENSKTYLQIYSNGISDLDFYINTISFQYNDIIFLIETYQKYISLTPSEILNQISIKSGEIKEQESKYNTIRNIFFHEIEKMLNIGSLYEKQYSILNNAYKDSEQKRFEYEKQDAIQRWAGTAYLSADYIDPLNSKEKLIKAQTVLNVLSNLYTNESSRPNNNSEYDLLLKAYEQTFSRKIKVSETYELIFSEIKKEQANNSKLYAEYNKALDQLGYFNYSYSSSDFNKSRSDWTIKDIIMVQNGRLIFSKDSSMVLSGIDESKANNLNNFFYSTYKKDSEKIEISFYEDAVRGLSERMAVYFKDPDKYSNWSLARNYLINSLIKSNNDLGFLKSYYSELDQIASGGSLHSQQVNLSILIGNIPLYTAMSLNLNYLTREDRFKAAWTFLTAEEKADLEFYTILTLTNNKDNINFGFSQVFTLNMYNTAYDIAYRNHETANTIINTWWLFPVSILWLNMRDVNRIAMSNIKPVLDTTAIYVNKWRYSLISNLSSIQNASSKYKDSNNKLSTLENITKPSLNVSWNEINNILTNIKELSSNDISELNSIWNLMQKNNNIAFNSVNEALLYLYNWTSSEETKTRKALETFWYNEEQKQSKNENILQAAVDNYINGSINLDTLKSAANNAYGKNSLSWKNHYKNIHAVLTNNLSLYSALNIDLNSDFEIIANSLLSLTSQTIKNRYNSELISREIEWNHTLNDLREKFFEWQNTSSVILENGRNDWIKGVQRMEEAYSQWKNNFFSEYERISYEWSHAYLAGLEDKEKWLEQAAYAANNGASESFLSLIGAEAERLARVIDTREPFRIKDAVPHAQALMTELLQSSGIINMSIAFNSLNNIGDSASILTKRGIGGISIWNTAAVKSAASDLARKTNSEIAGSEARKLAYNVRLTADEAVKGLIENVETANQNFKSNMDEFFIFNGLWRKSGNNYVKEIVKGSTLFTPVISETVTVTGYNNYRMEPLYLKTNLDEKHLSVLDSLAINILLSDVFLEVQAAANEIFGINSNTIQIKKNGIVREQSPGKFGAHIGYVPADKLSENPGSTRDEIFYDEGEGELGRLMSEFLYWHVINSIGNSELSIAPWDKRMWNDEGSFFKSPSLRTVGTIACTVVAGTAAGIISGGAGLAVIPGILLAAGISTTSNVIFGSLDVVFGYKKYDEVLFDVGKTFIMNTAGGLVSSGINYLSSIATLAGASIPNYILNNTVFSGLNTALNGLISSGFNGITYNSKDGLGYNSGVFVNNLYNTGTDILTTMTTNLVSSSMQMTNSGLGSNKLTGFNNKNITDVGTLNNLIGSLAGQAVNFAMGNDFLLNVFDLNFINGINNSSGLLELNFSRNGVSMNIGTGGANMSINNILSSAKGVHVWNTNSRITNYGIKNDFDSLVALRAQYGYGDSVQKNQLFDILKENVILDFSADGNYSALTTNIDGKRIISLTGYQNGLSAEEQFRLAVTLGHEAYRDGYVSHDNYLETRTATAAHTEMALKMIFNGEKIAYDENLTNDISAYFSAVFNNDVNLFNSYIDNFYDSSGDFWKLIVKDNIAGFIWDGLLDFDLSDIGLGESIETLNDDMLRAIFNSGANFTDWNNFLTSINSFEELNRNVKALETFLKTDDNSKKAATTNIGRELIGNFYDLLQGVESSGLLIKTDAIIANPGDGRFIFAAGGEIITCYFGLRAVNWNNINKIESHLAVDLITASNNKGLLMPMDNGSVILDFTNTGGLNIILYGEDNKSISYGHADGSSIRDYITMFTYNSVALNNNGSLNGIIQNMKVGQMGNTGTYTTGAHVHMVYTVNGIPRDPLQYLNEGRNTPITDTGAQSYARLMSGFSVNGLTNRDALGIYNFLSTNTENRNNFPGNYNALMNNNPQFRNILNSINLIRGNNVSLLR